MNFFTELKRRNVFRVGIAYTVSAWLLLQVTDIVFPRIGLSDSAVTLVIALLAIGFIPALIFAWAFEMTPDGLKREKDVERTQSIAPQTRRTLDRVIIVVLLLVIVLMAAERYWLADRPAKRMGAVSPLTAQTAVTPATENTSPRPATNPLVQASVAVLPFTAMSSGEDDGYFADGLTEEILNSLARLPELLVTARTSAFHFKGTNLAIPEIAATLGVAQVVEGSVRRDGDRVRITAQLIRAADGFHLWSMTYDRTLEDVFAVQEDIARNIAEVLNVVLDEDALARMRSAGIGNVEAFIAYQKGYEAFAEAHENIDSVSDALAPANVYFDQVLQVAPKLTNVRLNRADLMGHRLFEIAAGFRQEAYPGEGAAVIQALLQDYSLAWDSARPGVERVTVEVERTLFSDDWHGLSAKVNQALASGDCAPGNWIHDLVDAYGWADELTNQLMINLRCDPMSGITYMPLIQSLIWEGKPEEALQAISAAESRNIKIPFIAGLRLLALVAAGRFRDDPQSYVPGTQNTLFQFPNELLIQARVGDPARARQISDTYLSQPDTEDYSSVVAAAIVGNREAANAAAARIDQRPGGPFLLIEVTQICLCGAPWDLDKTPNFKARIEEAGFHWPPPKPIDYQLKTW